MNKPMAVALLLTGAWLIVAILFPLYYNDGLSYWGEEMRLGETGDYWAGWLTPVALLWLIFTIYQQHVELVEQRRISVDQFNAMTDSNEQLRKQAQILEQQYAAETVARAWATGRELQLHALADTDLRVLLVGEKGTADEKRGVFIALILNYYAFVFQLHILNGIPKSSWDIFVTDMRQFFKDPKAKARWQQVKSKGFHMESFVNFIETNVVSDEAPTAELAQEGLDQ